MSPAAFVWFTNALMGAVILGLLIHCRRERLKSEEDAAVRRGRMKHMTLDQLQRGYSPHREV